MTCIPNDQIQPIFNGKRAFLQQRILLQLPLNDAEIL